VAARSKACVCACSLAETTISNTAGGISVMVVCCKVQVSAKGRSFARRSPAKRGVSHCNRGTSTIRRSWLTRVAEPWEKSNLIKLCLNATDRQTLA
jgi:hypothetical protein